MSNRFSSPTVSYAAMPPKFYQDLPMYDKKFVPTSEGLDDLTTNKAESKANVKTEGKSETKVVTKVETKMETKVESSGLEQPKVERSSPRPVRKQLKTAEQEADTESVTSGKTLSNSLSFKATQLNSHFSKIKESNQENLKSSPLKSSSNPQETPKSSPLKSLTSEMTSAASDLGKQLTSIGVSGVNQIKKSVNGVANVASEFYDKLNQTTPGDQRSSAFRSTFRDLKLSSAEEQLASKREKFHQQNTTGHSVSSLNEMHYSLDRDLEGGQRKSNSSSLNGSNHSLIENNNTLNYILSKTQAMLRQQKFNGSFGLNGGRKDGKEFGPKEAGKDARGDLKAAKQHQRHIRFLPRILSTDSNNAIDSPENDDLNEKLNFPHLISKQFSIDSVDSLEFNLQNDSTANSGNNSGNSGLTSSGSGLHNLNSFMSNSSLFKLSRQPSGGQFNNNFTCFSNLNNLPSFTSGLPFGKQNSVPAANLLKQQLKQSIGPQNHYYSFKQRSLPSSPLFKKKLDSFERPFLPFLQNVSNIFDRHMFVSSDQQTASFTGSMTGPMTGPMNSSPQASPASTLNNSQSSGHSSGNPPSAGLPPSCYSANRNKRPRLVRNQFDSFDQRDLFVHCNGESSESTHSTYNSNWKPERGLLNCFDAGSFDAGNNVIVSNVNTSSSGSHQRLARQLSDKLINEKIAARQSSCEDRLTMESKKLLGQMQSASQSSSGEFRALTGQLAKLNMASNDSNAAASNLTAGTTLGNSQHEQSNESNISRQSNEPNTSCKSTNSRQSSQPNTSRLSASSRQFLKATPANYEKEKSEGYCSGSVSDRNSNYEELETNLESELMFAHTFSKSTSSLKSSHSTSSSSSSISSSLSCSSSLVILSSNTEFRSKIAQAEKLSGCLPSPTELGEANAFMLFICLTILLLHRDKIINENLDANDIAIYFDSKVRKHDVHVVINLGEFLVTSF